MTSFGGERLRAGPPAALGRAGDEDATAAETKFHGTTVSSCLDGCPSGQAVVARRCVPSRLAVPSTRGGNVSDALDALRNELTMWYVSLDPRTRGFFEAAYAEAPEVVVRAFGGAPL